ncbi:MAG: DnaJ domain-containing protein [Deltaproteobacteria bacterium]|nr:DnaJ domain-containing protein [Deltaproteobacteria bacterium]
MQLPGRLAKTTLGDLLGRVYRAGATGALEISVVSATPQRHRVHVQRGLVIGIELGLVAPPDRLGEVLVREGLASVEDVAHALSRQQLLGAAAPRHGELLVRLGVLSPEVRDAALRKQARARLDALFALCDGRDGELRFHVGPSAASSNPKMNAPLLPRDFLHGRRRARVTRRSAQEHDSQLSLDRLRAMRLLGVDLDADPATIRRAFRVAAARVHPDRHPGAPADERQRLHVELAELSAAYHLLCA